MISANFFCCAWQLSRYFFLICSSCWTLDGICDADCFLAVVPSLLDCAAAAGGAGGSSSSSTWANFMEESFKSPSFLPLLPLPRLPLPPFFKEKQEEPDVGMELLPGSKVVSSWIVMGTWSRIGWSRMASSSIVATTTSGRISIMTKSFREGVCFRADSVEYFFGNPGCNDDESRNEEPS